MTEETLFAQAVQRSDPAERAAFLNDACAGDAAVRGRVEDLLKAHAAAGSFLEEPVPDAGGTSAYEQAVATTPASAPAESAGMRIGPYKLLQKLGEGGMGAVWLAEQSVPVQRRVALKLIKAGMDSAHVLARFEAERQALALMDHPNIARVFDAGTTGEPGASATGGRAPVANAPGSVGRPYFVMELVKGVPITKFCDQERLSPRERLELFIPVCQAVQHAHQKGIIHRDLKPSNVLIALYDGKPVPKVIDFGVAKATSQKLTEQSLFTEIGAIVGTLEYMAPEQAELNNLDIDTRADIYSLGVLLYELLTGSPPFTSKQLRSAAFTEMLRMIREVEPQKPSTRISSSEELPSIAAKRKLEPRRLSKLMEGDLDWIVMKCLEKERARRYDTANGLALEIQRYLADEPVLAGPPSAAYRLRKFVRRNKGPVLASAVVLVALLGGIAGTTWGMMNAEQARAAAQNAAEQERLAKEREAGQRQLAEIRKGEAEANERKALDEKKIAEAVRNFLQHDLLRQADATEQANALRQLRGLGAGLETVENPTIKELLDRAAEGLAPDQIEAKFPGHKEVQASILRTVGDTYQGIGQYDKAVAFLERARDAYSAAFGPGHASTLNALNSLAVAYQFAGKWAQATELFEQVRDAQVRNLGADHPDTLATLHNLAGAYRDAGRLTEAIELLQQVRDASVKKRGADHPFTLSTLNGLAWAYLETGRLTEATELIEQVRNACVRNLGADHPSTLITLGNLARAYRAAGKLTQAIELLEQVRDGQVKKLGVDHPDTLTTLGNLATVYREAGRLPEALKLFEEILPVLKKKLGSDHPNTLTTLNHLATAYELAGRLAEALPLFEAVLAARKVKLGEDHPDTHISMDNLAGAYCAAGRRADAIPLFERLVPARQASLGPDHPLTLTIMNNLAAAYWSAGRLDRSVPLFEETLRRTRSRFGPDHPDILQTAANLAVNYRDANRLPEAIKLFEEVLETGTAKPGPDPLVTLFAKNELGLLYRNQGRYNQAEPLLQQAAAGRGVHLGATHLDTLISKHSLAWLYYLEGKYDQAVPLLEEILPARTAQLGADHSHTLSAQNDLALVYEAQKSYTKAEMLLRQAAQTRNKKATAEAPAYASALAALGLNLVRQGRADEAESLLRECLAIRQKQEPDAWTTFNTQSLLGGSLLGQKKYAEAEPLLLKGYQGLKEREAKIPASSKFRLADALERLVQLYEAWDKSDEAAKWKKELQARQPAKEKQP